jgi:hypothetical protein
MDLKPINVKISQTSLQSYIIWLKKSGLLKIKNLSFCNRNWKHFQVLQFYINIDIKGLWVVDW